MASIDKVRIIIVGDSGVGKTSLTHLITKNESLTSPGWTIGCSVECKLHEYKEGTANQLSYFIELCDIGGSISHKNTRGVFYNPIHGIILVHDLTNRKSHDNLYRWLCELLNKEGKDIFKNDDDFDPEQFLGTTQIPILVVGTKSDLLIDENAMRLQQAQRSGNIAEHCGAEEICLNSHEPTHLSAGTTNAVKLSRFFDKVIERKYYSKENAIYGDRRGKFNTPQSPFELGKTEIIINTEQKLY